MGIGDKLNDIKGKVKEQVGDATDRDDVKHEGQADQAEAQTKDTIDKGSDKLREGVDKLRD